MAAQEDAKQAESKQKEIEDNVQIVESKDETQGRRIGRWYIAETLGKGGYSWVKKGIDRKNGRIVALKFMERRLNAQGEWKRSQQSNIKNEIETLKCLRHNNIVRLLAYNLNAKYPDRNGHKRDVILLVLEYAAGGELFDILYYTEKLEAILARTYFHQLISGIECMHQHGIVHRDIKPQNLLLDNTYTLKITDFGLSKIDPSGVCNNQMTDWHVGTRGYQAPEILLRRAYDLKVDVFAMGVVLFILLGGYPPFEHAKETDKWYGFIVQKKYKNFWKSHRNSGLKQAETDLITRMICFDPEKRVSIEKIKKHPWYKNNEMLSGNNLIKVLRHRHQRMEQQRNADPSKQKILQESMKRPLVPAILRAVTAANKTPKDLPPPLPENEIINPYDIYTSTMNTAYEVLQGLERAVTDALKGILSRPAYNEVDVEDLSKDKEEATKDDSAFNGTYIDVVHFSLVFRVALMDTDSFDVETDMVMVHIGMFHDANAKCNLVKFTRLSGPREAFHKIIKELSQAASDYLTGLDSKTSPNPDNSPELQELYEKCFPEKANAAEDNDEPVFAQ